MENFEFLPITDEFVQQELQKAFIYNVSRKALSDIWIAENKFTSEMGGSAECVDIFLDTPEGLKNIEEYLNKADYFMPVACTESGTYNTAGMINLIEEKGINYKGFLIITRIMSSFILDLLDSKSSAHYYNICEDALYHFLDQNPIIDGWLAKNQIKFNGTKEELLNLLDESLKAGKVSQYSYGIFKDLVERGVF